MGTMDVIGGLVLVTTVLIQGVLCADFCSFRNVTIIQIPENLTVGSVVGHFNVVGNADQVVLTQNPPISTFILNVTSREITLALPLDFETQTSYRLNVLCEQSNPQVQAEMGQVILVKDINDNTPVFSANFYQANVSELTQVGTVIFSGISATDRDGDNLYMQYEVVDGPYSDYVHFDRASVGAVTLNRSLDYETMQSFTVEIRTLDTPADTNSPRRSAVVSLRIDILNEDDMDPAFTRDHYTARIDSSAAGGTIINTSPAISAIDQDLADKSPVRYTIWDYGNSFSIDPETATVTLQQQIGRGIYTAVLEASQVDDPKRRAVATLTLMVSENGIQDRAPSFLKSQYNVSVLETMHVDNTLVSVPAVDLDFGSILRYWLTSDANGMFAINQQADILLKKPLDYETMKEYTFEVKVTDEVYTSSVTVNILVEDANDNNPAVRETEIFVEAERDSTSAIAQITASDKDEGSVLSYSVVGDSRFSVNAQGEVFMTLPAEFYPESTYRIVVLVEDNGSPPRHATAHVILTLPKITTTYEPPTNAAVKEEPNDVVPIVLGVVAAVLLFVVIVLAIILVRSRKKRATAERQIENQNSKRTQPTADVPPAESEKRRAFQDENLEKAKPPSHLDPEGLAYRSTKPSNGMFPSTLDLNFEADHGETEDGATTIQHNPITAINHGYSGSDVSEVGRDMGDIRIQTSMTPYKNGYPGYTENDMYGAGDMKTFRHSGSSCESLSSDSTPGSKKQLVKPDLVEHGKGNSKPFAWNNLNGSTLGSSNGDLSGDGLKPVDEKPEITVYF